MARSRDSMLRKCSQPEQIVRVVHGRRAEPLVIEADRAAAARVFHRAGGGRKP